MDQDGLTVTETTVLIDPVDLKSLSIFSIHDANGSDLVTMYGDGHMEFGPNYAPDEAARIWWDVVARLMPDWTKPLTA